MKRIDIKENQQNPHFIGAWVMENTLLCDKFIDYFEVNIHKQQKGSSFGGVNIDTKDSLDITIKPKEVLLPENQIFHNYFENLLEFHEDYISNWPFINTLSQKFDIGSFNLQRYKPGQHFKKIHTERSGLGNLQRIFAFMTYLNDVEEGGETYFSHYDLEVKPKKGLTLIWPAEWTHAHRGNTLKSGIKYIITGWLDFPI